MDLDELPTYDDFLVEFFDAIDKVQLCRRDGEWILQVAPGVPQELWACHAEAFASIGVELRIEETDEIACDGRAPRFEERP